VDTLGSYYKVEVVGATRKLLVGKDCERAMIILEGRGRGYQDDTGR
jgi:hypothetical protein